MSDNVVNRIMAKKRLIRAWNRQSAFSYKRATTNLVRQCFEQHNISFDSCDLQNLDPEIAKELATLIIASFDTTALSLYWLISYIECDQALRARIVVAARQEITNESDDLGLAAVEAIRMGGAIHPHCGAPCKSSSTSVIAGRNCIFEKIC